MDNLNNSSNKSNEEIIENIENNGKNNNDYFQEADLSFKNNQLYDEDEDDNNNNNNNNDDDDEYEDEDDYEEEYNVDEIEYEEDVDDSNNFFKFNYDEQTKLAFENKYHFQQQQPPQSSSQHLMTTNDYEELLKRLNASNHEINTLNKLVNLLKTDIANLKLESNNWEQKYNQLYVDNKNLSIENKHLNASNEELGKEVNNLIASKFKLQHELKRSKLELDALHREYSQIMSERDSVHKEIEALQEQLCKEKDKSKMQNLNEIDLIKKDLNSALQERDKALNELRSVYEKIGNDGGAGGDTANLNASMTTSNNIYEKLFLPKEEKLLKENEKLQFDLRELTEEIEKAKKRRDLAFSERDKMMRERESIRALCDDLRSQRDKSISDLAEALRECDELKKQKTLAIRQIHALEENIAILEERLVSISQSNDNWRTFSVEVDLNEAKDLGVKFILPLSHQNNRTISSKKLSNEFFSNKSLNDDQSYLNHVDNELEVDETEHSFVVIDCVSKNGTAYGKLKENDRVLRINTVDMKNINLDSINNIINTSKGVVHFVITRYISNDELNATENQGNQGNNMNSNRTQTQNTLMNRSTTLISIHKTNMNDLLLETGVYVAALKPNSEANECLDIGDRIISINGIKLANKSLIEIIQLIRELHAKKDDFNLIVLKTSPINLNDLNFEDMNQSRTHLLLSSPKLATGSSIIEEQRKLKNLNRLSITSDTSSQLRDKISLTSSILSNNRLNLECLSSTSTISNSKGKQRNSTHFERIFSSKDKLKPLFKTFNTSGTSNEDVSYNSNNSLKYHHSNYYQSRNQQKTFATDRFNNTDEEYVVRELDDLIEDIQKQQQIDDLQEFERFNRIPKSKASPRHQQQQLSHIGTWPKYHRTNETTAIPMITDENSYQVHHATVSGGHLSARKTIFNKDLFNTDNKAVGKLEFDENEENIHHQMFLTNRNSKFLDHTSLSKHNTPRLDSTATATPEIKLPSPGEIRNINIEKNNDVLGINISENVSGGGVYVSNVINNSLASNAGIHLGDQLLEINGVNLRKAGYKEAAKILTDCGSHNSVINLLVQYNPAKYFNNHNSLINTDLILPLKTSTSPSPARCVLLKRSLSKLGLKVCGGNQTGIFIDSILSDCSLQKGDQILEWNNQDLTSFTLEKAVFEIFTKKLNNNIKISVQLNLKTYEKLNRNECDSFYVICLNDREKKSDIELKLKKFDIFHVQNTLPNGYPDGYWKASVVHSTDSTKQQSASGLIPSMKQFISELIEQQQEATAAFSNEESTNSLNSSLSISSTPPPSTSSSSKLRKLFKNNKQKSTNSSSSTNENTAVVSRTNVSQQFIDLSAIIKSIGNEELRQQPLTYKLVECIDLNLKRPCLIIGEFADFLSDYIVELNNQLTSETIKFTKIYRQTTDKRDYSTSSQFDLNEIEFGLYDYISLDELKECMSQLNQFAFLKLKNFDNLKELKHEHKIYPIVIYLKYKSFKQLQSISNILSSVVASAKNGGVGDLKNINNKTAKALFQNTSKLEKEFKSYITNYCDLGQLVQSENNNNANSVTSSSSSSNNTPDINTSFVDLDLLKQCYELIKSIISKEQNRMIWIPASNTHNNNIFI